jgi:hypothetical protein
MAGKNRSRDEEFQSGPFQLMHDLDSAYGLPLHDGAK